MGKELPARYRSRPVEITALEWTGGEYDCLNSFCGHNWGRWDAKDAQWLGPDDGEGVVLWNTKENQWLCCPKGHFIIRGLDGELYPCAPDIFKRKYEAV